MSMSDTPVHDQISGRADTLSMSVDSGKRKTIVMKFGGTSVGNIERIRIVAQRVKAEHALGRRVAVVVSAMAGVTNQMVGYCSELDPLADPKEYDAVVASGEQVTSGLVAIALQALGVPARSFQGWQIPLVTDDAHGKASIDGVDGTELLKCLDNGIVPVIAGFQGVGPDNRIATLGRGGSDTSAVAIAAAIHADQCDIYTDVDGIYTTDPRIVKRARKLDRITYEEMLELASVGAKVLQTRSVGLAMREGVRVRVLSSFSETDDDSGSIVVDEDEIVEKELVAGIASSHDEAKLSVRRIPDRPGIAAAIFGPLAEANINVDMIVQSTGVDRMTNMTFTVGKSDEAAARAVLESAHGIIQYGELETSHNVVKISVVGVGMRSNAGLAATMFATLAERGINVQVISTSEIKISVLIDSEYKELAMRALHTAYGLDKKEEPST
ncbi:aspartate kinase [Gluconobacter cerinus]|uniref:Aspartokinase n=2 Tax=Gluconobacter cerinus TaxID=38307 RepID=A0A1B6VPC5_9PROT|nr:aspartate kinase [Gluconobacter cerinus]MBS1022011.1 aspartate kinase [Gluconobacter cerinus]MBS1070810.1 aspartate kinase [Gluconobacter cerinus]MCW2266442.1 aspartate kinase [Gluconobacter cerinus]OAJ68918.1 aspartate kinase [Gluconobacter cerinus]